MILKLGFRNVKKSAKDFSIYFFTIILGIICFYTFDSLSNQRILFDISQSASCMWDLIDSTMKFFSAVVIFVLAFLILYANNFLIKRRKSEFGTYLLLGMSAKDTSLILIVETLLVGIFSLIVGLVLGILASQLMSFATSALLGIEIKKYHFLISYWSIIRTIITFFIIFGLVGIFNILKIQNTKLVNLIRDNIAISQKKYMSTKKSLFVFIISIVLNAFAYRLLYLNQFNVIDIKFLLSTAFMMIGTYLFFYSFASFLITWITKSKLFYKKLNMFTIRQISNKMQLSCTSLWTVCVLLFFALTIFSSGLGIGSVFSRDLTESNNYDASLSIRYSSNIGNDSDLALVRDDAFSAYSSLYPELKKITSDKVQVNLWNNKDCLTLLDMMKALGSSEHSKQEMVQSGFSEFNTHVIGVDEFNKIRQFLGREKIEVKEGTFAFLNSYDSLKGYIDEMINSNKSIGVGSSKLKPNGKIYKDGLSTMMLNMQMCYMIVPQSVINSLQHKNVNPAFSIMNFNYKQNIDAQEADKIVDKFFNKIYANVDSNKLPKDDVDSSFSPNYAYTSAVSATKSMSIMQSYGIRLLCTYLALYIGMILLFSVGSVISIQQLCTNLDSGKSYKTLLQIGAPAKSVLRSLKKQTCFFFICPLLIASIHYLYAFSLLSGNLFQKAGVSDAWPVISAAILIVAIYGTYMVITYLISKEFVKSRVGNQLYC